tara:strand:+ start:1145 stop:1399 length:255 start_codon:yes stop_codon:yes gene_type:complete
MKIPCVPPEQQRLAKPPNNIKLEVLEGVILTVKKESVLPSDPELILCEAVSVLTVCTICNTRERVLPDVSCSVLTFNVLMAWDI